MAGGLPSEWVKAALLAALPPVILVVSPQRVVVSILVAAAYALAALVLIRPGRSDIPVLLYVLAAAAFMLLSLLRVEIFTSLSSIQHEYALAKTLYFVLAVLPLSAGAALLITRLEQIRPAALIYVAVGVGMAVLTLGFCNPLLLGYGRYTWQGNLTALGTLLLLQFWIVRHFWLGAGLAVLTLVGLSAGNSKQSLVAVGLGLLATAAYWLAADRARPVLRRRFGLSRMSILPSALALGWLSILAGWVYLELMRARGRFHALDWLQNPAAGCGHVAGRIVAVSQNPGDRDNLVATAWQLFLNHPLFGGGPGSFAGLVRGYTYPHNVPLEVAAELGILGVAVLLLPLVAGWLRLVVAGVRARSRSVASLMAVVLTFAVVANLSGDLSSARALWIFGLIAFKFGFAPTEAVEAVREPQQPPTWQRQALS